MTQPDIALAAEYEVCVCRDEMSFEELLSDEGCSQTVFLTMTGIQELFKAPCIYLFIFGSGQRKSGIIYKYEAFVACFVLSCLQNDLAPILSR